MKLRLIKHLMILSLGIISSYVFGQGITTSGINGLVESESGNAIANANVTVIHTPTGTTYTTETRENGRFNFRGLRVGGPYTISASADGYESGSEIVGSLELSKSAFVQVTLGISADIMELEAFEATPSGSLLSRSAGAGTIVDSRQIGNTANLGASLNELARTNPFATVTDADRNDLTVLGQNNRFNSIQVDGVRTNDQFGLSSGGVASLRNPISLNVIEQVSVEIVPYDVRQSGFGGASINAVTKSGGNEFGGVLEYRFTNDSLRGDDVTDSSNSELDEYTFEAVLSGPIIKDKLFFLVQYEEWNREFEAGGAGFAPDLAAVQQVVDLGNTYGLDFGSYESLDALERSEEKVFAKIDWNITDQHQANFRYNKTDSVNPNVGNFDDFGETALDSNFYEQSREEEIFTAEVSSQWSDQINTTARLSFASFRQPTTFESASPMIEIDAFPGADGDPDAGELFFGTERFRHQNNLEWDTVSGFFSADYFTGDHVITAGFDYESTEFLNLFLESSFGNFVYSDLDAFLADTPSFAFRNTGIIDQNPVAEPEYAVWGFFLQDRWNVNDRLELTGGVRIDLTTSDSQPSAATGFEDAFGFQNNGSIDGEYLIAPRLGFKYSLNEDDTTVLRGGVGVFQSRVPMVWYSNAFTNNGETTGQIDIDTGLADYSANSFDPENPVIFIPREDSTPFVDAFEDGLKLPSNIRANIAIDQKVELFDSTLSLELVQNWVNEALYVTNENLLQVGTTGDGRPLYSRGGVSSEFSDVYYLQNTSEGESTYVSLSWSKPYSSDSPWFADVSYTYGTSREVNPFTSSRASSNFNNRAVFDPNAEEVSRSNFEIKNRFLVSAGYTHDWGSGHTSTIAVIYEGRSGSPFSYIFDGDINGDGRNNNDLLYVPTGINDPNVVFAPGFDTNAFFSYLEGTGLNSYAGGSVDRNSDRNEFIHRWDIKLAQEIPVYRDVKVELFADFLNVGNLINDEWGLVDEFGFPYTAQVASASTDSQGRYVFEEFDPEESEIEVDDRRSRWAIQLGVRVEF